MDIDVITPTRSISKKNNKLSVLCGLESMTDDERDKVALVEPTVKRIKFRRDCRDLV